VWFKKNKPKSMNRRGLMLSDRLLKDSGFSSDFILSAIEDGVVMVGLDGTIHLFNPAAATITGWPADEAVGISVYSVLAEEDQKGHSVPQSQHPFANAAISGKPVRAEMILTTRYHKPTNVSIIVTQILGEDSRPSGDLVGVFRDITKQKIEEQRRSDFISTASHEMRTPLAAIEGYLSLALNPKIAQVDGSAKNYLQKASTATKHLGTLFQDLLTSSRAEDGRLVSYPVVVEAGEVIGQVVESARFKAKEKNLELKFIVSAPDHAAGGKVVRPLHYTFVDPDRLSEVVQNLLDNAIKYTPEGTIAVRLTGDSRVVQLQIQDTGVGIPEEDIPHLFQKFYRVDSSTTRTVGGTGLGLFICKKIIELYNGRIWVESRPGKGSTFYINLPRLTSTQALELQQKQASTVSPLNSL